MPVLGSVIVLVLVAVLVSVSKSLVSLPVLAGISSHIGRLQVYSLGVPWRGSVEARSSCGFRNSQSQSLDKLHVV